MSNSVDRRRVVLAWLAAVGLVISLVFVAGGDLARADHVNTWPHSNEANHESFWEQWGAEHEEEDDWSCVKDETGSSNPYVLGNPPDGQFWRLLILKAGSGDEANELHWNPSAGASFEHSTQGGWSHVILCSRPLPEPDPGSITVVKETVGGDGTFDFESDIPDGDFSITTSDGEGQHGPVVVDAGTYSVSEAVPDGWTLDSAVCDNGDDPDAVSVGEGEDVTCTFVNSLIPDETTTTTTVPEETTTTVPEETTTTVEDEVGGIVVTTTTQPTTTTQATTTTTVADEVLAEELPFTGANTNLMVMLALALLATGGLALAGARKATE